MPEPFKIEVADTDIRDLKRRLAQTRWPSEVSDSGWQYGSNLAYMKELCDYWRNQLRLARPGDLPQPHPPVHHPGLRRRR